MKRTKEVSRLVGVSKRTLQYYDDEGVLEVERSENNHRLYDKNALKKIWEIMVYKEMGFELKEVKQLLLLPDNRKKDYFRLQISEIENQISKLQEQMECQRCRK